MQSQTTPPLDIRQHNYIIKGVAELSLFSTIDEKKTADNVREFFKTDFPRVRRMAEASSSLQSPTISDMPSAPIVGNSQEDKIIKRTWALEMVHSVNKAIKACETESQVIICNEFLHGKKRIDVQELVAYEHSQYFRKQRKAYNQFADAFEVQNKGIDLHCYYENKNGLFAEF